MQRETYAEYVARTGNPGGLTEQQFDATRWDSGLFGPVSSGPASADETAGSRGDATTSTTSPATAGGIVTDAPETVDEVQAPGDVDGELLSPMGTHELYRVRYPDRTDTGRLVVRGDGVLAFAKHEPENPGT